MKPEPAFEYPVVLPISDRQVAESNVSAGGELRLRFITGGIGRQGPRDSYTLTIGAPFSLASGSRSRVVGRAEAPSLPSFEGKRVRKALGLEDGTLEVTFSDDVVLRVAPDEYEPWEFRGSGGWLVVSVAGGGLAIWSP